MNARGIGANFALEGSPEGMDLQQRLELQKALQAGSGAGLSSVGGRSIVLEDLEGLLHTTTFAMSNFNNSLWKILKEKSVKATGIMHEFSRITGRGRAGMFGSEIAAVNTLDAQLDRKYAQVRFLRAIYEWSHVIGLVTKVEDQKTIQATNCTLAMTEVLERSFYDGDNALVSVEADGLYKQVQANAPTNIINLNGAVPSKEHFLTAAQVIVEAYGQVSHAFMPPGIQRTLDLVLEGDKDRIQLMMLNGRAQFIPIGIVPGLGDGIQYGTPAAGLRTSFGNVKFSPHLFVGFHRNLYLNQAGSEQATGSATPATPTFIPTATVDATSAMTAGNYRYRVTAENASGESVAAASQTQVIAAGERANLAITSGGGANAPTAYRIYRSPVGGAAGTEILIGRIADAAGTATFQDRNQRIAGTHRIYLCDLDSPGAMAAMAWAQLANMQSYALPMGETYFRQLVFIYGTLCLYNPRKVVILDNAAELT